MSIRLCSRRPGVTFVEVLIFVAILSIVGTIMIPLLFASTENRLLQESISIVEHNGSQILQAFGTSIRGAEAIKDPPSCRTSPSTCKKPQLLLQMSSGALNPTAFGVATGTLLLIQGMNQQDLSSSQVSVSDFWVQNTSVSGTGQSVSVTFTLTRSLRLAAPRVYSKKFEALFTLYPKNTSAGDIWTAPGCAVVTCANGRYFWPVMVSGSCEQGQTVMTCQ